MMVSRFSLGSSEMLFEINYCTGQRETREASSLRALAEQLRNEGDEVVVSHKYGSVDFNAPGCHVSTAWDVQMLAVRHGALDVEPSKQSDGALIWPADETRVSIGMISYRPWNGTFSGWSWRLVPEWTVLGYRGCGPMTSQSVT